ncbi:MAG: ABC transporter ATP-binding protein, partial [Pseudomonadota bacterium]
MLNVSHVDLHYGAAQILFDISFEAKEATITCVMGRNGVGKT